MSADSSANVGHVAKRARLETHDGTRSPLVGVLDEDADDADSEFYGRDNEVEVKDLGVISGNFECEEKSTISEEQAPQSGIPGLFLATATDTLDSMDSEFTLCSSRVPDSVLPPINDELTSFVTTTDPLSTNHIPKDMIPVPHQLIKAPMNIAEHCDYTSEQMKDQQKEMGSSSLAEIVNVTDFNQAITNPGSDHLDKSNVQQESEELISEKKISRKSLDTEFLSLAKTQKSDKNAEWRFDSSDAESSSDDSLSLEEEGYTTMKPEEIATLLLQEIDEEGDKSGPGPLRTRNEVPEDEIAVERPDIEVTAEMRIEALGTVDSIVDNMVLIRASVSGDYQVLSEGSLLVLEDRSVIGAVADTLGRVEEPLYTVRFNNLTEMVELNVSIGKNIFYVPSYATYVFTQPLLALKGTDASNIHDEEAGEGEIEFSDDETEAEYKRKLKETRRNTEKSRSSRDNKKANRKTLAIVNTDEPYVPLQRPANLHEMVAQPPPPPPSAHFEGRGRGNRHNRGEKGFSRAGRGNDRGRGRGGGRAGGSGDNRRKGRVGGIAGGRGGLQDSGPRSPQQSNKNPNHPKSNSSPTPQQLLTHEQRPLYNPGQDNRQTRSNAPQFNFGSQNQHHQPIPQFSQFSRQEFQQFPTLPSITPIPNIPLPSGAHVNPAFFGTTSGASASQSQLQSANWMQSIQEQHEKQSSLQVKTSSYNEDAFKALQSTLDMLKAQQQQQQQQR